MKMQCPRCKNKWNYKGKKKKNKKYPIYISCSTCHYSIKVGGPNGSRTN